MKREIKFRGKSIKSGVWLIGDYILNEGHHFIAPPGFPGKTKIWECFEIDPETLGQYTGMKDKDGREIYEDDIVDDKGRLRAVVFEDHMWCVQSHLIEPEDNPQRWYLENGEYYKVIGNIHDNPEWVKKEKNTKQ